MRYGKATTGLLAASRILWQWQRSGYDSSPKPLNLAYSVFEGNVQTDKNGIPLIIMHGLFGSKQNWRGIARALESKLKRRIFTIDARNHGDSPHSEEHNSAHMAADVAQFLRSQNIAKAFVMGHSMGGRAMMFFAMKYPELVERGIIVDISPISVPRDFSAMDQIFTAMKNMSVSPELPLSQGRILVENQIKSVVEHKGTVDFIMLNLRKKKTGEFYWAANVDALHKNLRKFSEFMEYVSHLPPFNGPMMFICGTQSNFVDDRNDSQPI